MFRLLFLLTLSFSVQALADATQDYVRTNAVPLESDELTAVIESVRNIKVVTIGEMHGSQEIPRFTENFFTALQVEEKNVILGLEIPEFDQVLVDKFVRTKDRSLLKQSKFFVRELQDGRSSEAMVKLLEGISRDAIVVCFDSSKADTAQERDRLMAKNLIAAYKKWKPTKFVVLAGNVHSAVEAWAPFDPKYEPMSYLLHTLPGSPIQLNDILAIKVRFATGQIWACMGGTKADCKIQDMNPAPSAYTSAVNDDSYFLREPLSEGYNATLFFRSLTASPPVFNN
jgi:hypothetical protein